MSDFGRELLACAVEGTVAAGEAAAPCRRPATAAGTTTGVAPLGRFGCGAGVP